METVNTSTLPGAHKRDNTCEICTKQGNDTLASKFCKDCEIMICADCTLTHTSQKTTELHCITDAYDIADRSSDNQGQEKQKCEPCSNQKKKEDAVMYCEDCEELFCQACVSMHLSQKLSKFHKLIPADQIKTYIISCEPCLENSINMQAVKACKICKEALCEKCAIAHKSQKATRSHELIDASNYSPTCEPHKTCQLCKETGKNLEAHEVCVECIEFLCKPCAKMHKTQKATKTHQVVSVNDILEIFCEPCLAKNIKILADKMCHECNEALCSTCITQHMSQKATKSHQFQDLRISVSEVKTCSPCCETGNMETAVKWCKTCEEFYCVKCSEAHIVQKATQTHDLVKAELANQGGEDSSAVDVPESRCDPCSKNGKRITADKYCVTCEEFYCTKCSERHFLQKATKSHDLVEAELAKQATEVSSDMKVQESKACDICPNSGKAVAAVKYCVTCEEFYCIECSEMHLSQKATKSHELVAPELAKPNSDDSSGVIVRASKPCDPCSKSGKTMPAIKFCETCEECYCANCTEIHQAQKATSTHKLVPVEKKTSTDASAAKEQISKPCDPCFKSGKTMPAIKFCQICEECYCANCTEIHQVQKATSTHKLVPVEKMTSTDSSAEKEQIRISDRQPQKGTFVEQTVAALNKTKSAPGKPLRRDVKSDSITVHWSKPDNFGASSVYQIRFKERERKWVFYHEQPETGCVTIGNLQADTTYKFQVRAVTDDIEGPYSEESDDIRTQTSLASRLLKDSSLIEDGQPGIYQLNSIENKNARNVDAKTRKFELGSRPNLNQNEKTILLVGATGTGKSTLVDGIVNYVTGVNWKDHFRFSLVDLEHEEQNKNQAVSQTEWITCYTINPEEGSRLPYRLKIIDTPGFGDTRGLDRDHEIVRQIKELFHAKGDQGVVYIDAVCFLVKAPDARLTAVQKYIFNAILSLFGQDIAENICTLITFADGERPPVLSAMKEAALPFGTSYVFNNSGLLASNDENEASLAPMFWEMGMKSFRKFFDSLENMPTKSLQQTKEVLQQREKMEVTVQNLQPQVDAGLSKLHELNLEISIVKQHEADIKANKDFEYEMPHTKHVKTELPKGQHVTNCTVCNVTCHENCAYSNDSDKKRCCAMNSDGYCTMCSENCFWELHSNTPYIFTFVTEMVKQKYSDKEQRYKHAGEEKITHEQVVARMKTELADLDEAIQVMMEVVNTCNNRLKEIALRPNPLTMVEHIDLMIDSEKLEKKDGFRSRIDMLQQYRKRAEIQKDVHRLRQGLATTAGPTQRKKEQEAKKGLMHYFKKMVHIT